MASSSASLSLACDMTDIEYPLEVPSAKCAVNRGCFASVACRFPRGTLKIGVWSWLGYNNRLSGAQGIASRSTLQEDPVKACGLQAT